MIAEVGGPTLRPSRDGAGAPIPSIGVIGYGYWGPNIVRNLRDGGFAELAAVAEPRIERHQQIRLAARGAALFDDHRRLLESDLDAVVIATPIHTHYELAREALLAGKHVLVEKPLAASVRQAQTLVALAERLSLTLMVGHTFVFNPAVQELGRMVRSGELGRIYHVDAARLNLGLFQRHANVVWDLAPHDLSILLHVLGRTPVEVSARGSCCVQTGVLDVAYLELLFDDGLAAQVHVSWLDPAKVRRVTVIGDRMMAVYNDVAPLEKLRIYDHGVNVSGEAMAPLYRHGPVTIPPIAWREPLLVQCEHFAECVAGGKRPLTDGLQGLEVVAVLEAASTSLASRGRRVPVAVPPLVRNGLSEAR